ncbi:MAG: hypothetical protein NVS2B14_10260 [Chamaesiphon sp.]
MRFKKGKKGTEMPHVDLVPLMDVILAVLTFFVLSSLSLSRQQAVVNVTLPSTDTGTSQQKTPDPLVVGLNQQGQLILSNQPASKEQLTAQMQSYLLRNPNGAVILKADRKLNYEQVVQVLGEMRDIGGDRVSLAIDKG